MKQIRKCRG